MNQNNFSHSNVPQSFKFPLISSLALCFVFALFLFGLAVSLFILVVVHNPLFFLSYLFLFGLIAAFLLWNSISFRNNTTILHYLRSLPDADLTVARHGHLVKITGVTFVPNLGFSFLCICWLFFFCNICVFYLMGIVKLWLMVRLSGSSADC